MVFFLEYCGILVIVLADREACKGSYGMLVYGRTLGV
jgi:hypothetical protein